MEDVLVLLQKTKSSRVLCSPCPGIAAVGNNAALWQLGAAECSLSRWLCVQ